MDRTPIPPPASRGDALGQLRRERWFADDAGETARVAEIDRQIQKLSAANSATAPTRETAAQAAPRTTAERTSQTSKKGARRGSAR